MMANFKASFHPTDGAKVAKFQNTKQKYSLLVLYGAVVSFFQNVTHKFLPFMLIICMCVQDILLKYSQL